jgi:hypothetical protein
MRGIERAVNGLARAAGCVTLAFTKQEHPMRNFCAALCLTLLTAGVLFAPAKAAPAADLVIEGRAAQALHCAAMLFIVSTELYDIGVISRNTRDTAQRAALVMLDQVPGTEDQRRRAMVQRFQRIMQSRSAEQLANEYNDTALWCRRTFID